MKWVVKPSKYEAWVSFDRIGNCPFEGQFTWDGEKSVKGEIEGTIKRDAVGLYKYSVRDSKHNTIDPRFRIKR